MTAKKKKYPYYAKWQFFFLIIGLGWITPITKHWDKFLLWDTETAYPIRMNAQFGAMNWFYVYKKNGRDYTVNYDGGAAYYVTYEYDIPTDYDYDGSKGRNVDVSQFKKMVYHQKEPPSSTLKVYVDPTDDSASFYMDLETMYDNENLFFPVALQIGMVAFFMAIRYK